MSAATLGLPMPKKRKPQEPDQPRSMTSTARLPVELLRQARTVAAHRNIDLGEYLVHLLQGQISRDYLAIIKEDKA